MVNNKPFRIGVAFIIMALVATIGYVIVRAGHAATNNADFNSDGTVGITDLSILASNFNKTGLTHAQGDANGDGSDNITDLSILASQWGTTTTPPTSYVTRQNTQLMLGGKPFHYMGFNDYPANVRGNCISGKATPGISTDLTNIDNGTGGKVKVMRAWFYQHLATTNGGRDWTAFDNTLAVAQAHGYKVIATLASGWGSCENNTWTDNSGSPGGDGYRDISFYMGGYKNRSLYDNGRNPDSGGDGATYYQWIQEVAGRYKNNSTIMMWQMINEGNGGTWAANANGNYPCQSASNGTTPTQAILSWENDVIPLMKSIDPNHLINVGMSNNSCGTSPSGGGSSAFAQINNVAGNDVCEYHDYQPGGIPTNLSSVLAACNAIGRPINIGEEGVDISNGTTLAQRASTFSTKFSAQFGAGIAGIEVWVWDSGPNGLDSHYQVMPGDPALSVMAQYGSGTP